MRVANAALELAQCSIVSETYEAVYEAVQMGEGAVLLDMCIGVCYVFCCTVYCTRCRLGLCQSCSSGRALHYPLSGRPVSKNQRNGRLPCPRFRWSSAPATGPPIG